MSSSPARQPNASVSATGIFDEPPSTPTRTSARRSGEDRSPSSLGGDSPERTPGPGEGSPALSAELRELEGGNLELTSLLAEAEERSSRRAATIQSVLEGIRATSSTPRGVPPPLPGQVPRFPLAEGIRSTGPIPRGVPPPLPGQIPRVSLSPGLQPQSLGSAGGSDEDREEDLSDGYSADAGGIGEDQRMQQELLEEADMQPRESPPPPTPLSAAPGVAGGLETADRGPVPSAFQTCCQRWEERCEQQQLALSESRGRCELEEQRFHQAQEALSRCEADCVLLEGSMARRDQELRQEILNLRSQQSQERERLRAEARRLQGAVKESHMRAKAESEARAAAVEQADSFKQQAVAARSELQKRNREGQDAKTCIGKLENQAECRSKLGKWIIERCSEVLDEEVISLDEDDHQESSVTHDEDTIQRVLSRTLAIFQQREIIAQKRGLSEGEAVMEQLPKLQAELLKATAEAERLQQAERDLQERLMLCEERAAAAPGLGRPASFTLRTEVRGRVRAAEGAQRQLQQKVQEQAEANELDRKSLLDEIEQLHQRLQSLQRAKEAGERYVESEENTWIRMQQTSRSLEAEAAREAKLARRYQAEAAEACTDAVAARLATHGAEAAKRSLEAELADLRQKAQHAGDQPVTLESASPWRAAAEQSAVEVAKLRQRLAAEESAVQILERRCEASLEAQRQQQAKIDEAKRIMMETALKEQADTFSSDRGAMLQQTGALREEHAMAIGMYRRAEEEQSQKLEAAMASTTELRRALEVTEAEAGSTHGRLEERLAEALRANSSAEEALEAGISETRTSHQQELADVRARISATQISHQKELADVRAYYGTRMHALRGEHVGRCKALAAVEDETRCLFERDLAMLSEAAEAAAAGEAAEAHLARHALREEAVSSRNRRVALGEEVTAEVNSQLETLCREVEGNGIGKLSKQVTSLPRQSHELLAKLRQAVCTDIVADIRDNPCSELRRSLCRDIKQELRDQVKSELLSELRQSKAQEAAAGWSPPRLSPGSHTKQVATTVSTAGPGSSGRQPASVSTASPPSGGSCSGPGVLRRGAALMEAFSQAASEEERPAARSGIYPGGLRVPSLDFEKVRREVGFQTMEDQASTVLATVLSSRREHNRH